MRAFHRRVFFGVGISIISIVLFFSTPAYAVYDPTISDSGTLEVPNQIIVKYRPGQTPFDIERNVNERESRSQHIVGKIQNAQQTISMRLRGEETPEEKSDRLQSVNADVGVVDQKSLFTPDVLGPGTPEQLAGYLLYTTDGRKDISQTVDDFKALPEVLSVDPNIRLVASETPNDPSFSQMWALKKMQAPEAWDQTKGDSAMIVAVIDTGADYNHDDLKAHLLPGKNFMNSSGTAQDDNGHGTHVSGTIGAMTNNGVGVAGINWNVKILPLKVLASSGGGDLAASIQAVSYAADQGAKVINLSLGSPIPAACPSAFRDAIAYAKSKGVTIVVASGNLGQDAQNYPPASCPGVIVVSATGPSNEPASYSNFGSIVTLSAPGGNGACSSSTCILSTWVGNTYRTISGTSMASPHVAGVVALMLAKNSTLTPDDVATILKNPANLDPFNATPSRPYGAGVLNALKAVNAAGGIVNPTATPGGPTPTPPAGGPTTTPAKTPSGPTPTSGPTTPASSPTVGTDGCPNACSDVLALPRSNGNANCDGSIDEVDYVQWRTQFKVYQAGKTIPKDERTANFSCSLTDPKTQKVTLLDFEIWRSHAFDAPFVSPPLDTPAVSVPPGDTISATPAFPSPTVVCASPNTCVVAGRCPFDSVPFAVCPNIGEICCPPRDSILPTSPPPGAPPPVTQVQPTPTTGAGRSCATSGESAFCTSKLRCSPNQTIPGQCPADQVCCLPDEITPEPTTEPGPDR